MLICVRLCVQYLKRNVDKNWTNKSPSKCLRINRYRQQFIEVKSRHELVNLSYITDNKRTLSDSRCLEMLQFQLIR